MKARVQRGVDSGSASRETTRLVRKVSGKVEGGIRHKRGKEA